MWNKIMLFRSLYKLAVTTGAAVALTYPCQSFAESWQFSPSITLEERYDDNIRLTTAPHDSVTGTLLRGVVGFSRLTENSGVTGRLHLDFSDYSDDKEIANDNNQYLTFASNYSTERTGWGLDGSFRRDSTLRSVDAILDEIIDERVISPDDQADDLVDDVDQGLVTIDVRRNDLKLTPSWRRQLDERSSLNVTYSFTDVTYDDNPAGSDLFDYDRHRISAGYSRQLSERDTLNASLGFARFKSPDNNDNKVDNYDLTVGYRRAFSETTSGKIDVGINQFDQKSTVENSDDNGFLLRLELNHRTEVDRYKLEFTHNLSGSGSGSVTEANYLKLNIRRNFSERLIGQLDMQYIQRKTIELMAPNTTDYYKIEPRLNWKLTRWWNLGTGYTYRSNKDDSVGDRAESNVVFVSIGYNKPITLD